MPEIVYPQRAYGGTRLGTCDSIDRGLYGCYLSVQAMILTHYADQHPDWQIDPGQLDEVLTLHAIRGERGGYVNGCDGYPGMLADLHGEIIFEGRNNYAGVAADLGMLTMDLEQEKILQLDGFFLGLGYPTHYVRCWNWDGSTLKVGNPWTGAVESYDPNWARRAITAIEHYRLPGFVPAWHGPANPGQPAPPAPPPAPPASGFQGVIVPAGAHVRRLPGTDQPAIPQPGSNPDIVDGGTTINFAAWCHHAPRGGNDVQLLDNAFNPPRPDDRWFQTGRGNWIASVGVNYQKGADPPANLLIQDPTAQPPAPPTPAPPTPDPVSTAIPGLFKELLVWETSFTFAPPSDYAALASLGIKGVLIRGANGDGTGSRDREFEQAWQERSQAARAAGLAVIPWTYWYGAAEGVSGDVAAYLDGCAHYTARRQIDAEAWVVDAEARELPGLGEALATLSALTHKPVFLSCPGDPVTYGVHWQWGPIVKAVAGLMPQLYTAAWQSAMSFERALEELKAVGATAPLLPTFDAADAGAAAEVTRKAKAEGFPGVSYWCWSQGGASAVRAYHDAWYPATPQPKPSGPPPPPAGALDWLRQLADWFAK